MKVKELMIGDWVMPLKKKLKGIPGKVITIDGGTDVCWIDSKDYSCLVPCSDVERIPLTPEILEKNGFENVSVIIVGTAKMRWVSEDTRTEITIWMDDTLPMEIVKNVYYEDEVSYTLPFPGTVHQLQHALRLCEIDKEIIVC